MSPPRKGRRRSTRRAGAASKPSRAQIVLLMGAGVGLAALGVNLSMSTTDAVVEPSFQPEIWGDGRVRVQVLNAGGVSGMAKAATERLRPMGFDVVSFTNAAAFDSSRLSSVIDRVGRTDVAHAVAVTLGIDNVQSEPDPNLYVDVTVVLGREWVAPDVRATVGSKSTRSWFDPRGWFGR